MQTRASLRALLDDDRVPADVRAALAAEFRELDRVIEKLEHGQVDIAIFGRVSVGKSALANALLGQSAFSVSPLHGETRVSQHGQWREYEDGAVHIIDTPGINELDGQAREQLAFDVCSRADVIVLVVDGDMTQVEVEALQTLCSRGVPVVLALNKSDQFTREERERLLAQLTARSERCVSPERVVAICALPRPKIVIEIGADGDERETTRERPVDIAALSDVLWRIVKREGKTLAALNAGLFASQISDQVATKITATRRELAERMIGSYALAKGMAVAINPIPVADLLAAAAIDIALVAHLGKIYGLQVSRAEAGRLTATIAAQLAALLGAIWGMHLAASALKGLSLGASTLITATAQGALAYYATYLVGRAAEHYYRAGQSWGKDGPKRAVAKLLKSIDRDSVLQHARDQIIKRLKT